MPAKRLTVDDVKWESWAEDDEASVVGRIGLVRVFQTEIGLDHPPGEVFELSPLFRRLRSTVLGILQEAVDDICARFCVESNGQESDHAVPD